MGRARKGWGSVRDADRIAVIRHGRIAELGNHKTPIDAGGPYSALYRPYETDTVGIRQLEAAE